MDGLWATMSEGVGLIDRAVQLVSKISNLVILIHQRYRQTDGQTDDMQSQYRAMRIAR